jgi:hypothetical protein
VKQRKPRTPREFAECIVRLAGAGKDRAVLALADEYGAAFLSQFTAEEWSWLDGLLESAQMAVDLEEWTAHQRAGTPAARDETAEQAIHAT